MPCAASWRLLLLRRCICPVLPNWCLPPLSWSHQWTRAWPFKLGVWPTPIRKSCKDCNQGNAEAKRLPTGTKWFFLLRAVAPLCCQTLTWLVSDRWIASSQTRSWADQRYRWHQCWPARFIHNPFHHPPISIHEPNKLMSWPCFSPVSNIPLYLRDTMSPRKLHISNFGLGWRGYHLSWLSKSSARRFCLQMVAILSTFWHPCRLEISQC